MVPYSAQYKYRVVPSALLAEISFYSSSSAQIKISCLSAAWVIYSVDWDRGDILAIVVLFVPPPHL